MTVWRSASKNFQFQSCAIKVVFLLGAPTLRVGCWHSSTMSAVTGEKCKGASKKKVPLVIDLICNSLTLTLISNFKNEGQTILRKRWWFSLWGVRERSSYTDSTFGFGFFGKNGKSKSFSMSWDSSSIVVGPPGLMANGIIILEIWTECTSL